MLNTLIELTKGESRGNIEDLKKFVVDGKYTPFQELLEGCTEFYYNGTELLIYADGQIKYSAEVLQYCGKFFVKTMYDKSGLVYDGKIDYNSDLFSCLYDLTSLKMDMPEKWIYNLDGIYDKYGLDLVTSARTLFDFWTNWGRFEKWKVYIMMFSDL